ncbi:GH36-type glycosyl hydrolase domain-containing protein [Anaerosporobacter sp.]
MLSYQFIDHKGTFRVADAENTNYLYFPIANELGIKSSVTPLLGGDCKMDQNSFILQPVSSEDLHNNKTSRNFWCDITGKGLWSATGMSMKQLGNQLTGEKEKTILEAGILYQTMYRISEEYGIGSTILTFVPIEDNIEIMKVDIRNISNENLEFTATAAIPIYGRSADNIRDHRHVTSLLNRIETKDYGVYVKPTFSFDERGHQKNDMIYYVVGCTGEGAKPNGFYPIVEEYIGEGGDFLRPLAIMNRQENVKKDCYRNGYEAMGAIQFESIVLRPQEECSFIIMIGAEKNPDVIQEVIKRYDTVAKVDSAFQKMQRHWDKQRNVSIITKDTEFNNFMQWVSFQPILRRIYGCSFLPHHDYGKGGRGWRDLWQDCLALTLINPSSIRESIINNYAGVRIDGSNATIIGQKQGEFIADRNNITRVWMDHGFWPLETTNLYIQQTGDLSVLLEKMTYFKDKQIARGEHIDIDWNNSDSRCMKTDGGEVYEGSVLEHILVENLTAFYDVGEHNHMRLRGADWNDALDMASERGESVAFTAAYVGNFDTLVKLLKQLIAFGIEEVEITEEMLLLLNQEVSLYESISQKQELLQNYCANSNKKLSGKLMKISCKELANNLKDKADWLKQHIRETEWIKGDQRSDDYLGWFNGYYDNSGEKVEGIFEEGIRMILTSQVFTIMSETATEEQVKMITNAADTYLFEAEVGGYRLNTDFKELKLNLGRMFGFAYGHKENGAVFSHMTVMYANALYQRGFVKEGYKAIAALSKQACNSKVSKIYPGIPEYFNDEGRGMYHYLTGAASWLMLTVVTQMFGVRGDGGDLLIQPKLLKEQFEKEKSARIVTVFADHNIEVLFINEANKEYGEYQVAEVYVNDKRMLEKDKVSINQYDCICKKEYIQGLLTEMSHQIKVILR